MMTDILAIVGGVAASLPILAGVRMWADWGDQNVHSRRRKNRQRRQAGAARALIVGESKDESK